jgi:hypothetical protein
MGATCPAFIFLFLKFLFETRYFKLSCCGKNVHGLEKIFHGLEKYLRVHVTMTQKHLHEISKVVHMAKKGIFTDSIDFTGLKTMFTGSNKNSRV